MYHINWILIYITYFFVYRKSLQIIVVIYNFRTFVFYEIRKNPQCNCNNQYICSKFLNTGNGEFINAVNLRRVKFC